ncbi:MAG: hypothetical protein GF372_08310, partial [Candidatus Marinimicrobia bacterium]|nr:hypothetical protein [Candidatus Neomarinimicrobiota bacterium]
MDLHWVVLTTGETTQWVQCQHFEGQDTAEDSTVTIYTDQATLHLEGTTAQRFWDRLYHAMQMGKRTIR